MLSEIDPTLACVVINVLDPGPLIPYPEHPRVLDDHLKRRLPSPFAPLIDTPMQLVINPSPKRVGQTVLRPLGVGHPHPPSLFLAPFVMRSPPFIPSTLPLPLTPSPSSPWSPAPPLHPFPLVPQPALRELLAGGPLTLTTR